MESIKVAIQLHWFLWSPLYVKLVYTVKWPQLWKLVPYEMPKSSIYKIYQLSTKISRITVALKKKIKLKVWIRKEFGESGQRE